MAILTKQVLRVDPALYNEDLTDGLEDFILDEVMIERKVEGIQYPVFPIIKGIKDWELATNDVEPDWEDEVTVEDIIDGDITEELDIDASDVKMDTAGTYEVVYKVREEKLDEVIITVSVIVEDQT